MPERSAATNDGIGSSAVVKLVASGNIPTATLGKLLDHQMKMERGNQLLDWAGLGCAAVVALAFLGVSAGVILSGYQVGGTILGTVDLVALVTVFVTGLRPS